MQTDMLSKPNIPGAPPNSLTHTAKMSPYYVDPAGMTLLQKHCAFFDRNGDGLIMPWETYVGMRILGYNVILALFGTIVAHLFFSYWTLDNWVPDPFFAIVLRNVDRLKHGSDTGIYQHDGTVQPNIQEACLTLFKWDGEQKGGLTLTDLICMTQRRWDVMDFFGWWAAKIEWFYLWVLCQKNGVVSWDDIAAQYDGSLFAGLSKSVLQQVKFNMEHGYRP